MKLSSRLTPGWAVRVLWQKKNFHLMIWVKNQLGMKNLYQMISAASMDYFFKVPRIPRSLLNRHREGLLLGSACEAGELYRAIVDGRSFAELKEIASYYDVLEVQPLGNNEYMLRQGIVDSMEKIQEFNQTVIRLGEELGKTCSCDGRRALYKPGGLYLPLGTASGKRIFRCRPASAALFPHDGRHAASVQLSSGGKSL